MRLNVLAKALTPRFRQVRQEYPLHEFKTNLIYVVSSKQAWDAE